MKKGMLLSVAAPVPGAPVGVYRLIGIILTLIVLLVILFLR